VQAARWRRALRRAEQEQLAALRAIVGHAQRTEFGLQHDFGAIRSHDDFAARVPVGDYDVMSPYIERMRAGEQGLLVPDFVRYWGNSSGSSNHGKQKFLPITERQIGHQRAAGADALMAYLAWARDDTFSSGFTLGLFPPTTMRQEGRTLVTSNPALMVTRMPVFTRPMYLPHDEIKEMAQYDAKLDAMAQRYLDWDIRAVAGTTCWFQLLFEKVLQAARRRGRSVRSVSEVWPNLRVLLGGGVSAEPYLPILRRLVGRDEVTLVDTYNATEGGLYAATDHTGAPGMPMLPHRGTFFEFVPLQDRDMSRPRRLPLWQVQPGELYSIVVTTVSGL
jgi:hypothetical protein